MIRKNENSKFFKRPLVFGFFLILFALLICVYEIYSNYCFIKNEENMIEDFFNHDYNYQNLTNLDSNVTAIPSKYIAVLEIEKIGLKTGLVNYDSTDNTVNKHVEILSGSKMPYIGHSTLILAGHSGTSRVSYFKKLHLLDIEDKIYLYTKGQKFIYLITDKYKVNKNGKISIRSNNTTLALTTCDVDSDNKQLVVIAELSDVEGS